MSAKSQNDVVRLVPSDKDRTVIGRSAIEARGRSGLTRRYRERRGSQKEAIMTMTQDNDSRTTLSAGRVRHSGRTQTDSRELRDAMGRFASGVTIVTGIDLDGPVGFTCQSFHSVSLEPALISISVMKTSTSYLRLRESGRFCVNVLTHGQEALSNQFARRGSDKWAGIEWGVSAAGNPVLDGTLLWIDCEVRNEYEAGDHYIVVAEVTELSPMGWHDGEPLVFFAGNYRSLQKTPRWPRLSWTWDD